MQLDSVRVIFQLKSTLAEVGMFISRMIGNILNSKYILFMSLIWFFLYNIYRCIYTCGYIFTYTYIYILIYIYTYLYTVYILQKTSHWFGWSLRRTSFSKEAIALNRAELVRLTDGMKKHMRLTDVLLEGKLGWINGDRISGLFLPLINGVLIGVIW